jgi:uncharacterized protein
MLQTPFQSDAVLIDFLKRISSLRPQIDKIVLFGSRARGDEMPYSDYDLLLVVQKRNQNLVDALYDAAVQVLCATGRDISLKIFSRPDFQRLSNLPTPFMKNVAKEGITLG